MCEKKSIARQLRSADVWQDPNRAPAGQDWRQVVLAEFEHPAPSVTRPVARAPERAPLQTRHLAMMAPAGVGLFAAGWLVGSGNAGLERLAAVPPLAWIVCAAFLGLGVLARRGLPGRKGRG